MPRAKKKHIDPGREPLAERILQEKAEELQAFGLALLRRTVTNQRSLARLLGWPPTTFNEVMHGRIPLDFRKWGQICYALGLDPVDALAQGRKLYRDAKEQAQQDAYRRMLEQRDAEAVIDVARGLSAEERQKIVDGISAHEERKTA